MRVLKLLREQYSCPEECPVLFESPSGTLIVDPYCPSRVIVTYDPENGLPITDHFTNALELNLIGITWDSDDMFVLYF